MSEQLNLERRGTHIAIIKSEKYDKTNNNPVVSLGCGALHGFSEMKLKEGESFQIIPDITKERFIYYIAGQSGSGKSWWCKEMIQTYKKIYPKREVYLISALQDDAGSLDKLKYIKRIKINSEAFLNDKIDISELKDSLVIFDDVDSLKGHPKKQVWALMNDILTMGRHQNISCLITYHVITSALDTKVILNESHGIVTFPATMGNGTIKYLFDKYLGLDNSEIKRIKKLKSRWVCVLKTYPKVIVSQHEIFIPSLN